MSNIVAESWLDSDKELTVRGTVQEMQACESERGTLYDSAGERIRGRANRYGRSGRRDRKVRLETSVLI